MLFRESNLKVSGRVALVVASVVTILGGCEAPPVADSHFWKGVSDASIIIRDGSGGAGLDPGTGSGGGDGTGGIPGSGGDVGSGGMADPGPSGGSAASGGRAGTGGSSGGGGGSVGSGGGAGNKGTGGMAGGSGSGGSGTAGVSGSGPGTLMVSVTTKSLGGRYEPDNVGAIWIADGNARFVKTLNVWGSQRRKELKTWIAASTAAGAPSNVVDAITSATKSGHGVRTGSWNGTNVGKVLVPDGPYKVCFELRDGNSGSDCVSFLRTRSAQTVMPPDASAFTRRSLVYTP